MHAAKLIVPLLLIGPISSVSPQGTLGQPSSSRPTITPSAPSKSPSILDGGRLGGTPEQGSPLERSRPRSILDADIGEPSISTEKDIFNRAKVFSADSDVRNVGPARKLISSEDVTTAREAAQRVPQLPASAFSDERSESIAKKAAADVSEGAAFVQQRQATLARGDLAMARYYLGVATADLDAVNRQGTARSVSDAAVQNLSRSAKSLRDINDRIAAGQPAVAYRRVTVELVGMVNRAGAVRVYVLPAGVIDRPTTFTKEVIRDLLQGLTFEHLAPTVGQVPRGDFRLWIGKDYQYGQMAELVATQQLTRTTPIRGLVDDDEKLQFRIPDDVID